MKLLGAASLGVALLLGGVLVRADPLAGPSQAQRSPEFSRSNASFCSREAICASSKGERAQFFPRRLAEFQKGIHSYPLFYQVMQFIGCLWGAKEASIVWRIIFSALAVVDDEHRTRIRLTMAQRATTSCMLGLVLTRASA